MQIEPIYEDVSEFVLYADKLIEKYPDQFGNIDVATIACVAIQNKQRSDKKSQLWDIKAIKPPISRYCQKQYIFVFFQHDWDELSEKHRKIIVADCLCSIPPGGGGSVNPMDYKDHSMMLRTLGVDYMGRDDVPDPLEDIVEWKK